MSLTLSDPDVEDLRAHLEQIARLEGLDGVHTPLASWAMEWLPKLAIRLRSLETRRSESIALRGESKTAREKRLRNECRDRDGVCSAAGFLGIECFGAPELHHVHGRGAGRPVEDLVNCELLCNRHHRYAQENNPSRLVWLERHRERSWQYGYEAEAYYTEQLIGLERAQHPCPNGRDPSP